MSPTRWRPSSRRPASTTGTSTATGSGASTTPTAGRRRSWPSTPSATCARRPITTPTSRSPGASCGSSCATTPPAASPTRTLRSRDRSRTRCYGARRTTARSRERRTSSSSARAAARAHRRTAGDAAAAMADRYLFVTGKLAAPALRETLRRAELPFDYEVAVMKITVAALMTPDWIARRLELPPEVTRIMIPGLCPGDPEVLSERFDVPAEKGPADLKRLPAFFGQADARSRYGARDILIFAEINNVPHLDRERILETADYYRDAGADVIDLGLSLDRKWLDEGPEVIADLKARGFRLSIDTLDPDEILMADAAGVDYVLSLNGHNRQVAQQLRATPVLIPDTPDDLDSLDATIAHLRKLGKAFLVDPIIEPIGSGFAASLGRYLETRRRHPDAEMMMGIGNLTELTEADTTGVTAILIGFCQELGIRNVLTTEVIDWARGAVHEAVLAAKLMHFAQQEGTPPKHVDGRLLTVKDEDVRPYTEAELRELHASITDPNIRIFTDADWIYALNAERFVKGTDINQIFDQLGIDEHTHAFYLGKELMKAAIARGLGKNYRQESPLDWGYLTFHEPRRERVRLTARPRGRSDDGSTQEAS